MFRVGDQGERLTLPPLMRQEVRDLIQECWAELPGDRPSFRDIVGRLRAMGPEAFELQPTH